MSQSPADSSVGGEVLEEYREAEHKLDVLIKAGFSFSGHERNCAFLNMGQGRFANVSSVSGFDLDDDGRSIALADWDHDGDMDVWIANRTGPRLRFLRNDMPPGTHFVSLKLQGRQTNRDGVGARVELVLQGDSTQKRIRSLRAGEGFLGQSSKWIHFGLGRHERIERIDVRWPSGVVQSLSGFEVDRHYRIVEGDAEPHVWIPPQRTLEIRPGPAITPPSGETMVRAVLPIHLPLPELSFEDFQGQPVPLAGFRGRPLLINLWASWCRPCLVELKQLALAKQKLADAGLQIIALSVDRLGSQDTEPDADQSLLTKLAFSHTSGRATAELVDKLQAAHNLVLRPHRPLPVPTSVLLDRDGKLLAIYKGPLEVDQLLDDVRLVDQVGEPLLAAAAPFSGTWHGPTGSVRLLPLVLDLTNLGYLDDAVRYLADYEQAMAGDVDFVGLRYRLGKELLDRGSADEAVAQFRAALEVKPDDPTGHYNLAVALQSLGRYGESAEHLETTLAARPDHARAHNSLAAVEMLQNLYDEALGHLQKSLEIDPGYAKSHFDLGSLRMKIGQTAEAETSLRESVRLEPTNSSFQTGLAQLLAAQGKIAEAVHHFNLGLESDPDNVTAHNDLGNALVSLRRVDEAIEHYQKALAIRPESADIHNNLAIALQSKDDIAGAVSHLQEAIRLRPDYAAAHGNLAVALMSQKETEQALVHFRENVRLSPEDDTASLNLGTALSLNAQWEEAAEAFRQAISLNPNNVQAQYRLGLALMSQDKPGEAVDQLRAAVQQSGDDPQLLCALAWPLAVHARSDVRAPGEAVALAERAAEKTSYRNPRVLDVLAAAYAAEGRFEQAVTTAQSALALLPAGQAENIRAPIDRRLELYRQKKAYVLPESTASVDGSSG